MKLLSWLLLNDGCLTKQQIAEAVEQQVISGDHLTDVLLDMGLLDEHQLVSFLEKRYGVKGLTKDSFPLDSQVLSVVPELFIWRYRIFPQKVTDTVLSVGIVDPHNRTALLELTRKCKRIVKPYVIAKRTWEALIQRNLGKPVRFNSGEDTQRPNKLTKYDVEKATAWINAQFEQAHTRADVSEPLLHFLASLFERVVVLLVRGRQLKGWEAALPVEQHEQQERIREFALPLTVESSFATVYATHSQFLGPLNAQGADNTFLDYLGAQQAPQTAFIVPLVLGGKVVQLFYMDRGAGKKVPRNLGDISIVLSKAAMVYEKLIGKTVQEYTSPPQQHK